MSTLSGAVISQCQARHRYQQWLKFLHQIDRETALELELHLIAVNYATHQHPKVQSWLKPHPRLHMHVTPTGAPWLNMAEHARVGVLKTSLGDNFGGRPGLRAEPRGHPNRSGDSRSR